MRWRPTQPWIPPIRAGTNRNRSCEALEHEPTEVAADLARPAAAPAADDRLDRRPARRSSPSSWTSTASALAEVPELILQANPALVLARLPRLLPRLPAARLALGDPAARDRVRRSACAGLDRDHLPLVARQLRRAGQARRRLPRLSAQDQQHGLAEPDVRDRLHRARSSTSSRSPSSALAAGFWSFRSGLPAAIQVVFVVGIVVVVVAAIGLFTMRNFGRRILVRAAAAAAHPRALRPVRGGRLRCRRPAPPARPGVPHRAHLDDRGAAPLLRRPGARASRTSSSGLSGAIFVALIGSLLTAVPLSPAGLGIVEAGVVGVLTVAYGVPLPEATAIALLDRVISVLLDHRARRDRLRRLAQAARDGPHRAAAAGDACTDRRLTPHGPVLAPGSAIRSSPPAVPSSGGPRRFTPDRTRHAPHRTDSGSPGASAGCTGTNG